MNAVLEGPNLAHVVTINPDGASGDPIGLIPCVSEDHRAIRIPPQKTRMCILPRFRPSPVPDIPRTSCLVDRRLPLPSIRPPLRVRGDGTSNLRVLRALRVRPLLWGIRDNLSL